MTRRLTMYYFEFNGYCGLRSYRNLREARKDIGLDFGRHSNPRVRSATPDDVAHVRSMGGYVPKDSVTRR